MLTTAISAGDCSLCLTKLALPTEFEEHMLRVGTGENPSMYLLDDVLRPGKTVSKFSFSVLPGFTASNAWQLLDSHLAGVTPAKLREYLLEIEQRHPFKSTDTFDVLEGVDGQRVLRQRRLATKVYGQLMLERLPRLKEVPVQWTLGHAKRALANGQFQGLQCDSYYTDDYARDRLNDYLKGSLRATDLLPRLIENGASAGWKTSINMKDLKVSVNQHNFNLNSFQLVL